jgi:hypothetical protein
MEILKKVLFEDTMNEVKKVADEKYGEKGYIFHEGFYRGATGQSTFDVSICFGHDASEQPILEAGYEAGKIAYGGAAPDIA